MLELFSGQHLGFKMHTHYLALTLFFFNKYNLAILMNNRMNWNNNNNNNKLCFLAEEWFSLGSTVQPYQYKVRFLRLSEVKCCVHIEFVSILGDA